MTGIYVKIFRDGKYCNVELETLSDFEFEEFKKDQSAEFGWVLAKNLVTWIRDSIRIKSNGT